MEKPSEHQATRAWCLQLLDMYRGWAGNRHMQLTEIADGAERNLPWLLISGFGAHRLLVAGDRPARARDRGRRAGRRRGCGVAPLVD